MQSPEEGHGGDSRSPELIGGRYEVLGRIGAGGMGEVFRARDRLTGQIVALKRISGRFAFSPRGASEDSRNTASADMPTRTMSATVTQRDRASQKWVAAQAALANEFRVLCSLRHPNIISVLDYGFAENAGPFYTMTLLPEALPLTEASRGKSLEVKLELLSVCCKPFPICTGMALCIGI